MTDMEKQNTDDKNQIQSDTIYKLSPVGWFNLRLLLVTGIKALTSAIMDGRTPTREVLAALDHESPEYDCANSAPVATETWIDYVADLGDGFNATHSISWLLGRDYLFLDTPGKTLEQPVPEHAQTEVSADNKQYKDSAYILPAGSTTVFGGDQVYPYASQEEYLKRTYSPYYAARPWGKADPNSGTGYDRRQLFAIPGNHDWYDGLISFVRRFCQPGRWMGCWQSQQKRSYFSLRLSHGFWLWGLDMTTDDDIDPPQLHYFEQQARRLNKNDQVVLCVPKPAWTQCGEDKDHRCADSTQHKETEAWTKIEIIESLVTANKEKNTTVPLIVAGDQHHYAHHIRQCEGRSTHLITCGGGGAYMLGTTTVPLRLGFPNNNTEDDSCNHSSADLTKVFPSFEQSRKMRSGVLKMLQYYPLFCTFLAATLLVLVWLVHTTSHMMSLIAGSDIDKPFLEVKTNLTSHVSHAIHDLYTILISSPGVLVTVLCVWAVFILFALASTPPKTCKAWGFIAGAIHFILQFLLSITIAQLIYNTAGSNVYLLSFLLVVVGLFAGMFTNGMLFSFYIMITNFLFGMHEEEIYSSQSIEDWKCFLRMRVNEKGLTVYPIGLQKIVRNWDLAPYEGETKKHEKKSLLSSILLYMQHHGHGWLQYYFSSSVKVKIKKGTTHVFSPHDPISPELIEKPFFIPAHSETKDA